MAKRKIEQLKTKHLRISPMTEAEMTSLVSECTDLEMQKAYAEMRDGALNDSANRMWYVAWKICLKADGQQIGEMCFKGPAVNKAVEIGYGLDETYAGNGYMTEAVKALIEWAFHQENVYFIEAETDPDNKASQKILSKLEFYPDGEGEEGPRFVLEKPVTQWMAIYMLFGLSIGLSFGNIYNNTSTGMCMGIAIGLCLGAALDANEKKKHKEIVEERNYRKNI